MKMTQNTKRQPRLGSAKVATAIAVAAVLALAGCTSGTTPKPNASATNRPLVIATVAQSNPKDLNPYTPGGLDLNGNGGAVYEPLAEFNTVTGKLSPWLAKSWSGNAANTVWTVNLQKGVKWSDGKAFTAADVVFTIQMLQKNPGTLYTGNLTGLTAKQTATNQLTITLPSPNSRFPVQYFASTSPVSTLWMVPEHIWKDVNPVTFQDYGGTSSPVGTGAYKFSSVTPTSWTLTRRSDWWAADLKVAAMPQVKTIIEKVYSNSQSIDAGLESNQIDESSNIDVLSLQTVSARNKQVSGWSTTSPFGYLEYAPRTLDFNTSQAPWNNSNLRWAVAHIVDRKKLIQEAYAGASTANYSMWADFPSIQPYNAALKKAGLLKNIQVQSVSQAQKMIESEGYAKDSSGFYAKDGKELSLSIIAYNAQADFPAIANGLVEQLRAAGINATADIVSPPNYIQALLGGNFQAAAFFSGLGTWNDPLTSMQNYSVSWLTPGSSRIPGPYLNTPRWNDANAQKYSAIVKEIAALPPTSSKITGLVTKALGYWYNSLPSIPLMQSYYQVAQNSTNWTGWPTAKNPYVQPSPQDPIAVEQILSHLQPAN